MSEHILYFHVQLLVNAHEFASLNKFDLITMVVVFYLNLSLFVK